MDRLCLLPWRPWRNGEVVEANEREDGGDLGDITALIPARNEVEVIERTLRSLLRQGQGLKIVLIDDGSEDGTAEKAGHAGARDLQIVQSATLPADWSGKLWALEQGRRCVATRYTLLLDADIELAPGIVRALREKMRREALEFVSLMAAPSMSGFWEKLLMPAFVYFFKALYPFGLVNSRKSAVAGAAGGCILLETRVLDRIGGFASIKSAVIDDCALARRVKSEGFHVWLGLTHSARSVRGYEHLKEIWDMVARTAFAQLRHSPTLLILCTLAMALAYCVPVVLLAFPNTLARSLSLVSLSVMFLTYAPTLRFYSWSVAWGLCLPMVAGLFLAMTWTSAVRYWQGERTRWKGRIYPRI